MPMTAPGTPVAAGAFAISSKPREDQLRPVPHDSAGSAEGHPERADLCSIRQWHPSSERSKYSAGSCWSTCWLTLRDRSARRAKRESPPQVWICLGGLSRGTWALAASRINVGPPRYRQACAIRC